LARVGNGGNGHSRSVRDDTGQPTSDDDSFDDDSSDDDSFNDDSFNDDSSDDDSSDDDSSDDDSSEHLDHLDHDPAQQHRGL